MVVEALWATGQDVKQSLGKRVEKGPEVEGKAEDKKLKIEGRGCLTTSEKYSDWALRANEGRGPTPGNCPTEKEQREDPGAVVLRQVRDGDA